MIRFSNSVPTKNIKLFLKYSSQKELYAAKSFSMYLKTWIDYLLTHRRPGFQAQTRLLRLPHPHRPGQHSQVSMTLCESEWLDAPLGRVLILLVHLDHPSVTHRRVRLHALTPRPPSPPTQN